MKKPNNGMPSLEVIIERLPEAVIAALVGPIVKQDFKSLQSLPALDMKTVAMLLRRKINLPLPSAEVVLERLPESVMSSFAAKNKGATLVHSLDSNMKTKSSLSIKMSAPKLIPKRKHMLKTKTRTLEVSLERLPEATMFSLLSPRKAMLLAAKSKKVIRHPRKMRLTKKCGIPKAALLI